jgi:hypothetical protein
MANNRGSFDGIDQTLYTDFSGGLSAQKFVTTGASTKIPGHIGVWDASGNLTDGGISGGVGSALVSVNGFAVSSDLNYTVNSSDRGFTVNGV